MTTTIYENSKCRRSGGIKRPFDNDNDVYFNDTNAFEMLDYLYPHYSKYKYPAVLDACCGKGALGNALMKIKPCHVTSQDIKQSGESILDYKALYNFDIILCNPPWHPVELPEAIYYKLISMLNPDGVLIFIIDNVFCYQGIDRAKKLNFQKYYFLPRFVFKSSGKNLLDCGVLTYHKDGILNLGAIRLSAFIPLSRIGRDEAETKDLFEEAI